MPSWTPSQISTDLWLDCNDVSTIYSSDVGGTLVADGGSVGRLEDKSGNARHAVESNASLRPVRSGTSIVFTADRLRIPVSAFGLGRMLIGVFNSSTTRSNASAGFININSSPNDNPELRFGNFVSPSDGGGVAAYWNSGYAILGYYNAIDSAVWAQSFVAGITTTLWKNGTQQATGTRSGTWSTINEFTLGYYTRISHSRNGTLRELIVCDPSNRQIVEGYLSWKWGLQSSLPASHPYKDFAPRYGDQQRRRYSGAYGL